MATQITPNCAGSWWTAPRAIEVEGHKYLAGITDGGEQRIWLTTGGTTTNVTLATVLDDDHNSPAIYGDEDHDHLITFYPEHNVSNDIPYAFIEKGTLNKTPGGVISFPGVTSYAQIIYQPGTSRLVLVTRVVHTRVLWMYSVSDDWGQNWTTPEVLFQIPGLGTPYIFLYPSESQENIWHFSAYGHPGDSTWRDLGYLQLNVASGDITNFSGSVLANIYTPSGLPLTNTSVDVAFTADNGIGEKTRLLWVGDKRGCSIIWYARWNSTTTEPQYYQAVRNPHTGTWRNTKIIASGGPFYNGTRNYLGGICPVPNKNYIVVCYKDGGTTRIVKMYLDLRCEAYAVDEFGSSSAFLARPIPLLNTSDIEFQKIISYTSFTNYAIEQWIE